MEGFSVYNYDYSAPLEYHFKKDGFPDFRDPVIHKGEVKELKILHDGYILEVFVNGGEDVYSVLL